MTIPSAPGVFDILPISTEEPWRNSYLWNYIENIIRETATAYGYKEIRTPIFERTELFIRGVGESSDIVSKEMYTFQDKGDRSLTLRPEGTAPVIRTFIEHQLHTQAPIHKMFYIGPMFRYERSQAGRYRQHHQFGAEAIGISAAEQDAELIDLVYNVYQKLGLKNLQVHINSLGNPESRQLFKTSLQAYLKGCYDQLSKDSQRRFTLNPLRILDSKDPQDQAIVKDAPHILDFLDEESATHFAAVKRLLNKLHIPYFINPRLVRGLDYYNKTVFEITSGELGAQNSVGGGGRYDGLMKTLGGPDLPTIGFGTGLERILQTMLKQQTWIPPAPALEVFLIPLGEQAKEVCFSLLHDLRLHDIPSDMDLSGKKLAKVMHYANQLQAKHVVIIGEEELKNQEVNLKNMHSGESVKIPLNNLAKILRLDFKNEDFLKLIRDISQSLKNSHAVEFFIQKLEHKVESTQEMVEGLKETMLKMKKITDC
jgi:histidyl-tRNA synthetase